MEKILVYSGSPEIRQLCGIYFGSICPDVLIETPVNPEGVIALAHSDKPGDLKNYAGFLLEATRREPFMLEIARDIVQREGHSRRLRLLSSDKAIIRRAEGAGIRTMYYPLTRRSCQNFVEDMHR